MRIACPTTEKIQGWWAHMQKEKKATKIYPIKDGGIYRLRAFDDNRKKCGELSLGLRDKRFAQRVVNSLSIALDDNSPAAVVNKYIDIKLKHAESCRLGKHAASSLAESTERSIKTIKSRLTAHLLPFCVKRHITNISDMYRREIIRAYIDELYQTVAIGDTARSIMASSLTMLRWYDGQNDTPLIDRKFEDTIKGWRSFYGFRHARPKIFLSPEQIQSILCYRYPDDTTKALIFLSLICGLRANEAINLRWRDLHANEGNMDILVAKGATARKAQYPKVMQTLLKNIQQTRRTHNLPGDYIFNNTFRYQNLVIYKTFIKKITDIDGKDAASNCLRRSGCDLINRYQHGLGDRQLGHSLCTKVTQASYINNNNFDDINFFWDNFYEICMQPNKVIGVERVRQMAMQPENIINFCKLDRKAM